MKIGIHGGSDQGTVDNCKRLGVDEVCLTLPYGDQGYVELDALKKAKDFLTDAGIGTTSGHFGSFPSQEVMTGQVDAEPELENVSRTMDSLGEIGFYSVLNFASSPKPPTEKEEQEYWTRLLDYYAKFVAMAENAKVRIATHAFYYPDRLVQGSDHLMRILEAIPSDYNGVTLCGGLYIPGDDVSKSVEMFNGKIFFAHARDLGGSHFASESDTVEVPLGEGEVNVPSMIDALQRVGYEGIICPEHLGPPGVEGEDQLGKAVKYLKRLM